MALVAWILSQASTQTSSVDDAVRVATNLVNVVLGFGVLGVVFLLSLRGDITYPTTNRAKDAQIARLQEQVDASAAHYEEQVLPALLNATQVAGTVVTELGRAASLSQRQTQALEEFTKVLSDVRVTLAKIEGGLK